MKQFIESFIKDCQDKTQPSRLRIAGSEIGGSELCAKIEKISVMLDARPNMPVCIRASNSLNWIAVYFAAKLAQRVLFVVPIEIEGLALDNLFNQVGRALLLTDNTANLTSLEATIDKAAVHDGLIPYDLIGPERELPRDAEILFTSGTMGQPKGVIVRCKCYENTALTLVNLLGMTKDHREVLAMPFSHSFGLGRLRAALLAGSFIDVHAGLGNSPKILKSILDGEVQGIGLVPAALEVFRSIARRRAPQLGENLHYIEIGSSALSYDTRGWLNENFPKTNIWHHYGMTEASRSFFIARGSKDVLCGLDHIGSPAPGVFFEIHNKDDTGVGELWLTGNNVASGYFANRHLTSEKFVGGGFFTGDLVEEIDGRIILKGRKDSIINVGGHKILAMEIENDVEDLPGVEGAICFAAPDKIFGYKPAVLVELSDTTKADEVLLLIQSLAKAGSAKNLTKQRIVFVPEIPKTSNGKKSRIQSALLNHLSSSS